MFFIEVAECFSMKISVTSKGAYVGRCYYHIFDDLGSIQLETGKIWAGQTRETIVSDFVHTMKIRCENQRFISTWGPIFEFQTSQAQSICFEIGGTTIHPTYSHRFC